jgi:hypothetical protein
MKKIILGVAMSLLTLCTFASDVLTLNNAMVFSGEIVKIKGCIVLFKSEGIKYEIPVADIFSLEFEDVNNKVYTDYMKLADNDPNKCMSGRMDAENYHGKNGSHFVLGLLFGPFAMIGTALANPTPEKGKDTYAMSQNKNLFSDPEYLSCYKKKAKGKMIGMEALGWGTWILFLIAIS